ADRALPVLFLLLLPPLSVAASLPLLHAVELLLEAFLLACVRLERVVLLPAEGFARRLVFRPAARVLARAALPFVELDDTRDRPVEEVAVVRDDHGGAVRVSDETLEPRKAVEVEVVRRLVEEEDVEARKQGRREVDAGARRTVPPSISSSPARMRNNVDFPTPFGPTSPIRARGGTTTVTSSRTRWAPWLFVMLAATSVPDGDDKRTSCETCAWGAGTGSVSLVRHRAAPERRGGS